MNEEDEELLRQPVLEDKPKEEIEGLGAPEDTTDS